MHKRSPFTLPLLLGLYLAIGAASSLSAQSEDKYWAMLPDAPTIPEPQRYLPQVPEDCRYARILPTLRNELEREGSSFSISIPTPDGAFLDFLITPTVVVAPEVAPLYTIKTFKGQAQNAPQVRIRCDISSSGFRALVFMRGQGVFVVEPFEQGNSSTHIVYYKDKLQVEPFQCGVEETVHGRGQGGGPDGSRAAIPTQKRTYRIAIIADDTYRAQFGGMPYMAENVLNSLASGVNMINEVFERDMGVSFTLVSNEQCANASIDDHTDLGDIQDFLANSSGLTIDGYDIGHSVLWANTGGVAYLRAVCRDVVKGGGFSGNNASFTRLYIDYAAHEIGHQMGANHTFVSEECGTSRNNFRFEPGEGSTIMAYAGVCGIGHQNFSDPYFHAASLVEMHDYMSFGAGGSCGTTDNTGNANSPIADALANITIPRETPFVLVGRATDANGDSLTYAWQQYDGEGSAQTGLPDCSSNEHPLFRFRPPVTANYRVFPEMTEVLAGNNNGATWEKLPCTARSMAFRMTVRDNNLSWGRTDFDDANVTVANTGPFAVVVPNGGETWNSDLPQTVTWSVNGTDAHCAEVDILLSTNNGNTFSLLGTFPNTGTAVVTLPPTISFNARILIQCSVGGDFLSASTFFDVSDDPFNLTSDNVTFDCFDILANIGEPCENLPFSETVATTALGFPNTFAANPSYTITVPDHFSGDYELRLTANGEVFGGSWREEFRVRLTDPDGNNATLDAPGGNADEWRPSGQTSPGELAGNTVLGQVSNPAGSWTVEVRLSFNEGPQINANVDISFTLEPVNVNGIATDECECLPPDCPELMANIGAPCDDGNPSTGNDAVTADCDCIGQSVIDCEGVAGGNALPGTACDDGDSNTGNDTYDDNCNCTGTPIDCEGVAGGNALPGTPCDDGDSNTGNDTYDDDCNCTGTPIDCEGVAGGNALPGTTCDDGDPTTGNDTYDEDCNCAGTPIDCEGVAGGNALPGTACDDGDPTTGNDIYDDNCNCTGTPIDCEGVAGGNAQPGTACDDGDPTTGNDIYDNDCNCVGQPIDCEGVAGGSALPGTPCDDGDPSTGNDTYDDNCNCTGTPIDCENIAGGNALPGTPCDDGDPNTGSDTYDEDCNCTGTQIDCEGIAGGNALPGTACDDGDPNTGNDTYDDNCNCTGMPIDCEGVAGGNALPGTACDDGDPTTDNDTYDDNCNCTGMPIDCEGVAGGNALPGTACDDGDPTTGNDTYDDNCNCTGTLIDCENIAGGNALPGTPCDDGDPNTGSDTYDDNCNCVGVPIDCEGTPGGSAQPGTTCDDGDPNTGNDTYDDNCNCTGMPIDCEGVAGGNALPGTTCDDGDPCTLNEVYDEDCNCTSTGEPALLTVEIQDNPTPAINCTGAPVTLQVSVSNANPGGVAPTWSSPDNGQLVAGTENSLNPRVSVAGTFVLELTDNSTGCTVSDTIVVALDTLPPLAVAQVDGFIGCTNETATLDATQSDFGPDIVYAWFSVDLADTVGTDALQPVGAGGFYVLTVLNTATGCSAADSVFVVVDEEVPPVLVSPAQVLTCQRDTVPILVSVDLPPGTFSLSWAAQSPAPMPLVENDTIARITEPGFYEVTVVNDLTGCELTIGREVLEDREWPGIALASDRLVLSCVEETAFLEASVDSAHSGLLVYQWQNSEGEHLGTDTTLTVDAPGMYFFQAENTENGCTAIDSVLVSQDVQAPNVELETADAFNCLSTEVLLSAAPTGEAADFDLSWSSLTGGTVTPLPGTMTATVDAPGTYELAVTSLANGCDSVVLFEVVADTLPPAGEIALPSFLGCLGQTVSLDASSFGNNSDFDIEWSSADGQVSLPTGSFLVNVDAPGTYTLSVTNPENGCQTIVSTTVELDPAAPVAVGTTDNNELSCGSTATLDGTGSSEGDHYDYEWANVDGMSALPVPASVLTATVDSPGSYVFIVTNINTGCADTSAAVAIIPDLNLPTAAAQVDEVGCDGNAFLSANLPVGATGQWTISGTGEIVDPTANATEVIGLGTAPVTLTWTISLENCPDFSSATVVVQPESAPEAQNDQLVVMRGATQGDLNVLANDVVGGGVTFELLTEPALGHLTDLGNGNLSYTLTTTLFGAAQDEFSYRICNANCPERCAEALVRVTIERDKMEIEVPNGITPNGDGINDALVFDQLLLDPDKYPDNELIIFSRWGDIVFKAGPYGNNWQGTNMEGQNLPDGTYYYVLRLDVGSGEIIKGDVTILR